MASIPSLISSKCPKHGDPFLGFHMNNDLGFVPPNNQVVEIDNNEFLVDLGSAVVLA